MSPVVSTVLDDLDTRQDEAARREIAALQRAFHGPDNTAALSTSKINNAQLTVTRNHASDFQDRQVYLYVDGELWGKVKYNRPVTREIPPGRHTVRAFNTLFSHTIEIDAVAGEHVRLKCSNALGRGGWIMMVLWQIAALRVTLEREL
jgi:hypothetical protein